MRTNGLTAEDYAPVAELDTSLAADALLALRDAGVAAYAVRPEGDDEQAAPPAGTQTATVFADRKAIDRARAVIHGLAPEAVAPMPVSPVDEVAWQQIVSGFSATASEPEHDPALPASGDEPGRLDAPGSEPPAREPHPLVSDDDEHFTPDPPPPPPDLDLVSRLAWAGVFGGPLVMLSSAMLSWAPPRGLVLLCALGFIGGMVTLVLRMKDRPPRDGGGDDGAVV
jgi:hypothetical protein